MCFCRVFKEVFSEKSVLCYCVLQATTFYEQLDFSVQYVAQFN